MDEERIDDETVKQDTGDTDEDVEDDQPAVDLSITADNEDTTQGLSSQSLTQLAELII